MKPRVKCPCCGADVEWSEASVWRPFCSERCKTLDLGAWASDRYSIRGAPDEAPNEVSNEVPDAASSGETRPTESKH